MAGRDIGDVARPEDGLLPVLHPDHEPTRLDDLEMVDRAELGAH